MKKLTVCLLAALLSLAFIPLQAIAKTESVSTLATATKAAESAKVKVLLDRLDEIKAIDKSKLSSSEKKLLRKEVRATKEQLETTGGGVYLSVGAIIIIILLLILLF